MTKFNYKAQNVILGLLKFGFIFLFLTFYTFILTTNDDKKELKITVRIH